MPDDTSSFLGLTPPPSHPQRSTVSPSDFSSTLTRRYSDAYTEAHAVVAIGKVIKGVAIFLFAAMLIGGFIAASDTGGRRYGPRETNGTVVAIGFALACLIGVPTYILGILVKSQGQTQLATLDTAVNSSRHLKDEDIAQILSKRFSL